MRDYRTVVENKHLHTIRKIKTQKQTLKHRVQLKKCLFCYYDVKLIWCYCADILSVGTCLMMLKWSRSIQHRLQANALVERWRLLSSSYCTIIPVFCVFTVCSGWLGSRVVSVLDSGAEGPGFKLQSRRCRITVLGKLFTLIVPLFTKQQNQ